MLCSLSRFSRIGFIRSRFRNSTLRPWPSAIRTPKSNPPEAVENASDCFAPANSCQLDTELCVELVGSSACFDLAYETGTIRCMGKLLEHAMDEAHKLPDDEQEAIGAWLLAEIESERKWDELFSRPPSEALERMAQEALEDYHAGRTTPLDPDLI
jgi:hypothetical protein